MISLPLLMAIGTMSQSPKGAETHFVSLAQLSPPIPRQSLASVVTNEPWHLSWVNPTNTQLQTIRVYHGTSNRVYTEFKDVGVVTNYDWITNPSNTADFFTVTAINVLGQESKYANEVPELPASHLRLTWTGSALNISNTTVLPPIWRFFTNAISPLEFPITGNQMWFESGTNKLKPTGFNPLSQ
jgi:hypothetical protein